MAVSLEEAAKRLGVGTGLRGPETLVDSMRGWGASGARASGAGALGGRRHRSRQASERASDEASARSATRVPSKNQ